MSNAYCSIADLEIYVDARTTGMLSNDDGVRDARAATVQAQLDAAAAELDTHLAARVTLPLAVVSPILTQWVARRVKGMLYGRRSDKPRAVDDDTTWCDNWLKGWDEGRYALPNVSRDTFEPALTGRAKTINRRPVTGLLTGTDRDWDLNPNCD